MIWREPKITMMIAIFAVAMLGVTTLKIRKFSFTRTFLQIYALLFLAQRYLYLSQQKYLKMLPLIFLILVEMMRNYMVPPQWRPPGFGAGGGQQIQVRTEDKKNGDLGVVAH
jgi:hypothetical protein